MIRPAPECPSAPRKKLRSLTLISLLIIAGAFSQPARSQTEAVQDDTSLQGNPIPETTEGIVGTLLGERPLHVAVREIPPRLPALFATEHQVGERRITIEKIAPPIASTAEQAEAPTQGSPSVVTSPSAAHYPLRPPRQVFIYATIVDHRLTLLDWQVDEQRYQAWSGIDFTFMTQIQKFTCEGEVYQLTVLPANISSSRIERTPQLGIELPDNADSLAGSPTFFPLPGTSERETPTVEALVPIAALHRIFAANEQRLRSAHLASQEKARRTKAEQLANPPKAEDTVVQFWRRTDGKYTRQSIIPAK